MSGSLGQGYTGVREQTPDSLLLDAGLLYAGVDEAQLKTNPADVSAALAAGTTLGATRGGTTYESGKDLKPVEYDGKRYDTKGMERIHGYKPVLTTNLMEFTRQNVEQMLGQYDTVEHTDFTEITHSVVVDDSDYIDNIAIVAKLSGTDIPVIIVLRNALMVDQAKWDMKDHDEAINASKFLAHAETSAPLDCPVSIYYPRSGALS